MSSRTQGIRVTLAGVLFVAAVVVGFWKLTSVANKANNVAEALDRRVDDNARTIRFLCDQSYVQVDVVDALLAYRRAQEARSPDPLRVILINRLEANQAALVSFISDPKSPCNTG